MKVLQIDFNVDSYEAYWAYWTSGNHSSRSRLPLEIDVSIRQPVKPRKYPTPWFVKVSSEDVECVLLKNNSYYDMLVYVNGDCVRVAGLSSKPVPLCSNVSEEFVDVCMKASVVDLPDIKKAWANLSLLSWETSVNAFAEVL